MEFSGSATVKKSMITGKRRWGWKAGVGMECCLILPKWRRFMDLWEPTAVLQDQLP